MTSFENDLAAFDTVRELQEELDTIQRSIDEETNWAEALATEITTRTNPVSLPNFSSAMKTLKRFEQAAVENSWSGAGDPVNFGKLEQEYHDAKKAMADVLKKLTQ